MLSLDLVDSLSESLKLPIETRHRVDFRLFRDAVETIDLLKVLHSRNEQSFRFLSQWYENNTPRHVESRKFIQESLGKEAATLRENYYKEISKFTHRTYSALLKSFSLGQDKLMVHDLYAKSRLLVLPHTIASGYAVLADLIIQAIEVFSQSCILNSDEVKSSFQPSLETNTIPRRFLART